jgi:hypothetical protein
MVREIGIMPLAPSGILQGVALSIDAAFLSMGCVDDGQADGPYPDMYEYWSNHHLFTPIVMPRPPAQGKA